MKPARGGKRAIKKWRETIGRSVKRSLFSERTFDRRRPDESVAPVDASRGARPDGTAPDGHAADRLLSKGHAEP